MSTSKDTARSVSARTIERQHAAVLHKKADGVSYGVDRAVFYPGFPNGGEEYADIHAPWGSCFDIDIPHDGAIVLKATLHAHETTSNPSTNVHLIDTSYKLSMYLDLRLYLDSSILDS